MKIAFLSRFQNKIDRGAETFVKELSLRLKARYQVEVLENKEADSIKKVVNGKYDIVIPINGRMQSLKVSFARLLGGYKVLITGHSGIGRDDIWNIAVCRPDVFVALTDYMAKWAKNWAWESRVVKIPNGIDLKKFSNVGEKINIDLPRPIIISAGALDWYKHHEKVIEAVSKMGKGSLLIAGEGFDKERLQQLGERLLKNRFKIVSFNYSQMPSVYRSCDLFTLPSWEREAFGIVYLEAMASGIGVVAPDDGSRREIVGEGGLLVNVNDANIYAKVLERALSINWSKQARVQAEKFSWDKVAGEYEKLMLSLIKDT